MPNKRFGQCSHPCFLFRIAASPGGFLLYLIPIFVLHSESLEGYLGKVKSDGVEAKDWDWKQQKDILIQITHGTEEYSYDLL